MTSSASSQPRLCYLLARYVLDGSYTPELPQEATLLLADLDDSVEDADLIQLASVYPERGNSSLGVADVLDRLASRLCHIDNREQAFCFLVLAEMRTLALEEVEAGPGARKLNDLFFAGVSLFGGEVAVTDELSEMVGLYSEWKRDEKNRGDYEDRITGAARAFLNKDLSA